MSRYTGPTRKWFDRRLLSYPIVWAAAGTPHHVFGLEPARMQQISAAQVADFSDPSQKM